MEAKKNRACRYNQYKASFLALMLVVTIASPQHAFARPAALEATDSMTFARQADSDAKNIWKYYLSQIPALSTILSPSRQPDVVPAGTSTGPGPSTLAAGFISAEAYERKLMQTTIVGAVDTNRHPLECQMIYHLRIWDDPQAAAKNLSQGNVANISVPITAQSIYNIGVGPYGLSTFAITLALPDIQLLANKEYVVAFTVLSNFSCGTFYALTTNYAPAEDLLNVLVGPGFGIVYLNSRIAMSYTGYANYPTKPQDTDAADIAPFITPMTTR